MAKLTPKQKAFCEEYLIDLNATQAAIRAGYSSKTARVIGQENLTKPAIKQYIDEKLKQMESERIADATEVMEYLTNVIRGKGEEPTVVQEQIPVIGKDNKKKGYRIINKIMMIPPSIYNRNKAAELMGKHLGMFKDKVEVSGALETGTSKLDSILEQLKEK